MAEKIKTDDRVSHNGYFGACPTCGKSDGYVNVLRNHWFYCTVHRMKWCIGTDIFTSWMSETLDDWRKNTQFLRPFTDITPK